MAKHPLAVGSLVRLKAGGPVMTIYAIPSEHAKYYVCQWFAGKKLDRGHFQFEELVEAALPPDVPAPSAT